MAGQKLRLNVLIKDAVEAYRYFKLYESDILIRYSDDPTIITWFYEIFLLVNINMSLLHNSHINICNVIKRVTG